PFARTPPPKAIPSDLNALLTDTLALYNGLFREIVIERRFATGLPTVRLDPEQTQRVVVNLVENAVEALGGASASTRPNGDAPLIVVTTLLGAANGVVRL